MKIEDYFSMQINPELEQGLDENLKFCQLKSTKQFLESAKNSL